MENIQIFGAKVHNLKNLSVDIPRNTLTVITGPSGSGKSSLAFDTLYAEGQRRYIESLSSYARQFLGQMEPPEVESISGLSPAIAIDQKSTSKNPRSTVGTITEIYDFLRVLYARVGDAYCPESGELLDKMLIAINIKRQNIYTSYAINFRPPEDRKPTSQEIKRYSNFLKEHISIIDPKIIILMGSTAMEAVTGINEKISSERGKWKEIILNNNTYPLMITFNPSYLIRYPDNKKYSWEDLKKIREKVKELKLTI